MDNLIVCDARPSSTLDWKEARAAALAIVASGKKVLWHLDFGLFGQLQKPLNHPGQFANFSLAIDHFQDKLWKEFHKFSQGVVLYKGSPEFSLPLDNGFSLWREEHQLEEHEWMEKLYLRDLCGDYLEQLSRRLSEAITPYIIFDPLCEDPLLRALLTDPASYGRIKTNGHWKVAEEKEVAIYLPSLMQPAHFFAYRKIFKQLEKEDFKIIPENQLITSWQGLDVLHYHSGAISPAGHRKIQGFLAAGGQVIEYE